MRVLMVCLGNICRSPMAEGILRDKAHRSNLLLEVDSAGTANYHVGEAPDYRAIQCMKEYGVDISMLRGRQFSRKDFELFDHILVMDRSNLGNVLSLAESEQQRYKVRLILEYSNSSTNQEVPDPWYGDKDDFHKVHSLLSDAMNEFLKTPTR